MAFAGCPPLSARNLALFTHTTTNAAPAKITPARRSFIPIILCFLVCAEFAPRSHPRAELFDCVTAPFAPATQSLQLDVRLLRHLLSKIHNVVPPLRVYRRSLCTAPRQTTLTR